LEQMLPVALKISTQLQEKCDRPVVNTHMHLHIKPLQVTMFDRGWGLRSKQACMGRYSLIFSTVHWGLKSRH